MVQQVELACGHRQAYAVPRDHPGGGLHLDAALELTGPFAGRGSPERRSTESTRRTSSRGLNGLVM